MAEFSVERILERRFEPVEQRYSWRDASLYALGIGLGQDPGNADQRRFIYEQDMRVLPTMPVVLATSGFWHQDPALGIDWRNILHGEQGLELHDTLPVEGHVVGSTKVLDVIDRGAGKGAFIYASHELSEASTGRLLATLTSTTICRANGGYGGKAANIPAPHPMPDRTPDVSWEFRTDQRAALIYRLSGDYNPLHIDPSVAASAGFTSPILHGLCTFGIAGHALLREVCDYDPSRLRSMKLRFSAPVFPGDVVRTEIWRDGSQASFRCSVPERGVVVINNGVASIEPGP